ncbi:MAG: aminopeptidase P N-terminal domain-containing protein [Planctomycetota bacterium]
MSFPADTLPREVFVRRRAELLSRLEPGDIALFRSAPEAIRNSDVHHEYRQHSDLYYLTGFEEPNATLILAPGREKPVTIFVQGRDPKMEIWTGRRTGPEGARRDYALDEAFEEKELSERLPAILDEADRLFYARGEDPAFDRRILEETEKGARRRQKQGKQPTVLSHPGEVLHEMRLIKTPDDQKALRRATDITVAGHLQAMKSARPGQREYEVQATLEYTFRMQGSPRNGYPSIVASGENATILHYVDNRAPLKKGELLLIDAGAEWGYFTGDVTRTFAPGGRFQGPAADLYDAVLEAEQKAIAAIAPGNHIEAIHEIALHSLVDSLLELGLLEGSRDEVIETESYKQFFMHRTSHWLGMDVHDVGLYKRDGEWRPFVEGMVLTVEPGLYVAADDESVAPEFRGLGIRIEDDVLVTAVGHDVLTEAVPREREAVEALTMG